MATPNVTFARPDQPPRTDHRATGTGKTITLQTLAENLSKAGVPVFLADIKGDLTAFPRQARSRLLAAILAERGLPSPVSAACPTRCGTCSANKGHPVRATVSDMGPLLLARMLDLNDTQAGVLQLVFKIADDNGLLLLDLKRPAGHAAARRRQRQPVHHRVGNISAASIGAIQRGLLQIEQQGATNSSASPCSTFKTSCRPCQARA